MRRTRLWLVLALFAVMLPVAMPAQPALAATITVNTTDMQVVPGTFPPPSDGACSLIEALWNARTQSGFYPDCTAGTAGGNTVVLQPNATYAFVRPYPGTSGTAATAWFFTNVVTITGNGATLTQAQGSGAMRLLYVVEGGHLILNNVQVRGVLLPDTADGAVYNDNAFLTINGGT